MLVSTSVVSTTVVSVASSAQVLPDALATTAVSPSVSTAFSVNVSAAPVGALQSVQTTDDNSANLLTAISTPVVDPV